MSTCAVYAKIEYVRIRAYSSEKRKRVIFIPRPDSSKTSNGAIEVMYLLTYLRMLYARALASCIIYS